MTYYSTNYLECQDEKRIEKLKIYILNVCCSGPFLTFTNDSEVEEPHSDMLVEYKVKLEDFISF